MLRGLREPHRVKSKTHGDFKQNEMDLIRSVGNRIAAKTYLARWDDRESVPSKKDNRAFKRFLSRKYDDRRWYSEAGDSTSSNKSAAPAPARALPKQESFADLRPQQQQQRQHQQPATKQPAATDFGAFGAFTTAAPVPAPAAAPDTSFLNFGGSSPFTSALASAPMKTGAVVSVVAPVASESNALEAQQPEPVHALVDDFGAMTFAAAIAPSAAPPAAEPASDNWGSFQTAAPQTNPDATPSIALFPNTMEPAAATTAISQEAADPYAALVSKQPDVSSGSSGTASSFGAFSGATTARTPQPTNVFGSDASAQTTQGGGIFEASAPAQQSQGGSVFGGSTPATAAAPQQPQAGSVFGGSVPAAAPAPQQPSDVGIFGSDAPAAAPDVARQSQSQVGGVFGSSAPATAAAPQEPQVGSVFGGSVPAAAQQQQVSSVFGSSAPAAAQQPQVGSVFGGSVPAAAQQPQVDSVFGSSVVMPAATAPPAGSIFGDSAPNAANVRQQPQAGGIFGSNALATAAAPQIQAGGVFGSSAIPAVSATMQPQAGNVFGGSGAPSVGTSEPFVAAAVTTTPQLPLADGSIFGGNLPAGISAANSSSLQSQAAGVFGYPQSTQQTQSSFRSTQLLVSSNPPPVQPPLYGSHDMKNAPIVPYTTSEPPTPTLADSLNPFN